MKVELQNWQYRCPGATIIPVVKGWYATNDGRTFCAYCAGRGCLLGDPNIERDMSDQLTPTYVAGGRCACEQRGAHPHWCFELDPVCCEGCAPSGPAGPGGGRCIECNASIAASCTLCSYCSTEKRRCTRCGVDESVWRATCRLLNLRGTSRLQPDWKDKFERKELTAADLQRLSPDLRETILNVQKWGLDAIEWE